MRFKPRKCFFLVLISIILMFLLVKLQNTDEDVSIINKRDAGENIQVKPFDDSHKANGVKNDVETQVKQHDISSKMDWHDIAFIKADLHRAGPGEQGVAVHVHDSERGHDAYADNGFNIKVSDRISLNRSLPDIRHPNCQSKRYLSRLPNTSVIIPFHNEGWSTLFRTIHSVMNRSPKSLLHEIILVDDFSSMDHLKSKLDLQLAKYPLVKLIRTNKREGLIRARLTGVNRATGQAIVILDSHVEATHNWLPPLLEPIAMDRKVVTCPMIDIVDKDDFHYLTQPGDAMRGAFDWELYYKRIPIPPEKQPKDPSDPFEDPVMAGGLFAVDRLYFQEIGQYDPGLEIWGGEQYELSFKVWMCGGRILDAPCSRVGHIYRKFMPYSLPRGTNINKNFKRVAEVWMDEYKEYFYKKRPHVRNIDTGPLEKQIELRNKLNCKSFHWFMTEIAPDIVKHYPPVMPAPAAWGKVVNEGTQMCLDTLYRPQGGPITVSKCKNRGLADQDLILTWKEDIRPGRDMDSARKMCVDGQSLNKPLLVWDCHGQYGNQLWKYREAEKQLYHAVTGLCASAQEGGGRVILLPCDVTDLNQHWSWENTDAEKLRKFNARPNSPA